MEEAITALLASVAGGRRYWVSKPQSDPARPYVVIQRIDGLPDYTMAGPSGYVASRLQFDVYADSFGSSIATARALKETLSGYRSGAIQGVFIDSERNLPAADAGEVSQLFRISIDAIIHHTET